MNFSQLCGALLCSALLSPNLCAKPADKKGDAPSGAHSTSPKKLRMETTVNGVKLCLIEKGKSRSGEKKWLLTYMRKGAGNESAGLTQIPLLSKDVESDSEGKYFSVNALPPGLDSIGGVTFPIKFKNNQAK